MDGGLALPHPTPKFFLLPPPIPRSPFCPRLTLQNYLPREPATLRRKNSLAREEEKETSAPFPFSGGRAPEFSLLVLFTPWEIYLV